MGTHKRMVFADHSCSNMIDVSIGSLSSHFSQVHNILAEMVMGGMVLETNMNEIITQVDAQNKMEKSEVSLTPPVYRMCMTMILLPYSLRYCIQYAGMCVCCTLHATLQ